MGHDENAVYLGHMLDMTRRAIDALAGRNRADYDADDILKLGLTHLVQVIGEAARKISPELPWRQIIGMRHRIVHDYMRVDEDILWEVVINDLPSLLPILERITPKEQG
ncbi:MAG: DUF86 domain-containing protein [Chloroflexi bacterium]|nr:DUF86 domain-containing protein [Chloroflexota bacterium]